MCTYLLKQRGNVSLSYLERVLLSESEKHKSNIHQVLQVQWCVSGMIEPLYNALCQDTESVA